MADLNTTIDRVGEISRQVGTLLDRRLKAAQGRYTTRMQKAATQTRRAGPAKSGPGLAGRDPLLDRRRAAHAAVLGHAAPARQPVDRARAGRQADRCCTTTTRCSPTRARSSGPCNHALLRIVPPNDVDGRRRLRPFIIIDPRAGHGPGIGGFKEDSEVGVALSAGHPVYFVIFYPGSGAGADARRRHRCGSRVRAHRRAAPSAKRQAGARRQLPGRLGGDDARRVAARHRGSLRRATARRCRTGRATTATIRCATPAVSPAAPGCRCSRAISARGKFDGAHLVQNFENLNPANTLWKKYYDLARTSTPSPSASSSSSAGGAASISSTRRRSAGSSTTCSSATSSRRATRGSARAATSI